jgi:uncharacterized protein
MSAARPLPVVNDVSRPFWEACRRGVLVVQACRRCGHRQLYPRSLCHRCHARELEFVEAEGTGAIVSFTVVHRAASPAFADDVPYVLALVELDEGPRMLSTVSGPGTDTIDVGTRVRVWFDDAGGEVSLPRFAPDSDV